MKIRLLRVILVLVSWQRLLRDFEVSANTMYPYWCSCSGAVPPLREGRYCYAVERFRIVDTSVCGMSTITTLIEVMNLTVPYRPHMLCPSGHGSSCEIIISRWCICNINRAVLPVSRV